MNNPDQKSILHDKMFEAQKFFDQTGIDYTVDNDCVRVTDDLYLPMPALPFPDLGAVHVRGTFHASSRKIDDFEKLPAVIGNNLILMSCNVGSLDKLKSKITNGVMCTHCNLPPFLFSDETVNSGRASDTIRDCGMKFFAVNQTEANSLKQKALDEKIDLPVNFFRDISEGEAKTYAFDAKALIDIFDQIRWRTLDAQAKELRDGLAPKVKFRLKGSKP